MRWTFTILAGLALLPAGLRANEKLPPNTIVSKLEIQPSSVELRHIYDYRQLLITAITANGERIDVTRMAKLKAPTRLVNISPTGFLRAKEDGSANLTFDFAGQSVSLPVKVSNTKKTYEVSFVRDVMPAMSKLGCNQGTCHGSAEGKAGFKMSLRGYDPLYDYRALTDDLEGRRFNRSAPDRSLMLLKPAGAVPHVGGVLMNPGDPYYEMFKTWIAEGVKLDLDSPRVVSIEVAPQGAILPLIGMKQQMVILAKYSNGVVRDVTAEAFVESSNTEVATVDKNGLVTAVRRGEATMLARYEGSYAASTLIVMGDRTGFQWVDVPTYNRIDELVYEKLKRVKVLPSEVCTDEEFVRRLHLDLTGLPPSIETLRAFLEDKRDSRVKRESLVDQLVGSQDFVEHWTNKWADLLQVNRKFLGEKGAAALRGWIRQAIASNMPYDQFVEAILTTNGSTLENPPAAYFKVLRDAENAMENTTHLFLAIRFNCNKCHDHPFERWTQDQYYQMTSFFTQVSRKEDVNFKGRKIGGSAVEGAQPEVEIIRDAGSTDAKNVRTGVPMKPTFPFTHNGPKADDKATRRVQLAKWITAKENPYFAKSYVNRIWSYILGVGLIEPVDDIRAGNPPSNPALLDYLTDEFIKSGFDQQHIMRLICKSRTYQHSIKTNKFNQDDEINYSHALARRLPAEVLYDAIHRATGSTTRLPGLPVGARAAQLLDSSVPIPGGFLELFGKPPRESACECERSGGMMLGPVLAFVNGPVVGEAIRDPNNAIAKLVAEIPDDTKLVQELFLRVLNRMPTEKETRESIAAIRSADGDFKRLIEEHDKAVAALKEYEQKQLPAKLSAWEAQVAKEPSWTVVKPRAVSAKSAKLSVQADSSILAGGPNNAPEIYTVQLDLPANQQVTGVRLEALTDPNLPSQGPGRAPNGNFVLTQFNAQFMLQGKSEREVLKFSKAIADFEQANFTAQQALENNPQSGWAIYPEIGKSHQAWFTFRSPLDTRTGGTLILTLNQRYSDKMHQLGKFRLSFTTDPIPAAMRSNLPPAILAALTVPAEKRTPQQVQTLLNHYRPLDTQLAELTRAIRERPQPVNSRLVGAQDVVWALLNSPGFLFNH